MMYRSWLGRLLTLLVVFVITLPVLSFASSDDDKLAEGKIALEKYKDCQAALDVLLVVSPEGRKNPFWNYYTAQAYECVKNYKMALDYMTVYNEMLPGQPAITDRLADLRYRLKKQIAEENARKAEAERVAAAKAAEAKRIAEEKAAVEALRNDLSGTWVSNTGRRYTFTQGPNGIKGVNQRSGDVTLEGYIVNGSFKGWIEGKWDSYEADRKCPYTKSPKQELEMTISSDGKSLQGYLQPYNLDLSDCSVTPKALKYYYLTRQ